MPFRNVVLMIGAFITFILSTLISWYEGAQLRDIPWEWEYIAIFSNWANDGFTNANNLLVIDHFVYASKFEPFFPILMVVSLVYMIFQLVFQLFKRCKAVLNLFLFSVAIASFVICSILFDSQTMGFKLFSFFFGTVFLASIIKIYRFNAKNERMTKTI